jgi:hypothetical protein
MVIVFLKLKTARAETVAPKILHGLWHPEPFWLCCPQSFGDANSTSSLQWRMEILKKQETLVAWEDRKCMVQFSARQILDCGGLHI